MEGRLKETEEKTEIPFAQFKRKGNIRKRSQPEGEPEEEIPTKIVSSKTKHNQRAKNNPLIRNLQNSKESSKMKPGAFTYESSRTAMPHGSTDQMASAYLETEPVRQPEKKSRTGPVKPPLNVRLTCRFDYQPDLCKDYKETGYCGYGDNCKFLHDRGDYKTGWQLEEEWEQKRKNKQNPEENFEAPKEEEFPFACPICRDSFTNPVVTKCGHYFCEECALEHNKKANNCFLCEEKTMGIFNNAHKLNQKIKERNREVASA